MSTPVGAAQTMREAKPAPAVAPPPPIPHPKELVDKRRRLLREKRGRPLPTEEEVKDAQINALNSIGSLREMGNDCFKKGEFQNAIIYYSRAVAVEPNDARLYSNRSAAFCVLKMLGRALKDALTAILLKPRWAKGYFRAGAAFFFLGQLQEALDMFELARDLDPLSKALHGACYDCRSRLKLLPVGSVPEIGKVYNRPATATLRDVYGSGSAYTWGGGDTGSLGHGDTDTLVTPKCVDALRGRQIADYDCGVAHVVAITTNGETFAWGDNREFQCGLGFGNPMVNQTLTQPTRIPALIGRRAKTVACGGAHTILITHHGEVFVWGAGQEGQLGLGDKQPRLGPTRNTYFTPTHTDGAQNTVAIAAACGHAHTIVVTEGGICHAFGRNSAGQLGLQDLRKLEKAKRFLRPKRVFIGQLKSPALESPASTYSAAVTGRSGRAGSRAPSSKVTGPVFVHANIVAVACGLEHTVAVSSDGDVYTAGSNEYGQLGLGKNPKLGMQWFDEAGSDTDESAPAVSEAPATVATGADSHRHPTTTPQHPASETGGRASVGASSVSTGLHTDGLRTARSVQSMSGLPGVVAFRRVALSGGVRAVMAACGDYFTVLLSELRDVYTFGRGDSGQLGNGTLTGSFTPQLVKDMQHRFTEYVSCRSDQVVCVCRNGEVYWWGSGLRYRQDAVMLEGVKKEVLEGRLAFSKTLPTDAPNFMVSSSDKAAPKFKQRVADYYKRRGVFSQAVIDKLGIQREQESLLALTMPSMRKQRPKISIQLAGNALMDAEHGVVADGEAEETEDGEKEEEGKGSGVHHHMEQMDMAMSIMSLVPVRTTLPKDARVTRLVCGEDFYVAVTDGPWVPFSRVKSWDAKTDSAFQNLEAMKRYSEVRQQMETMFGSSITKAYISGTQAAKEAADAKRKQEAALAAQEQDEELRELMEARLGHKLVQASSKLSGWASVMKAIGESLVYRMEAPKPKGSRRASKEPAPPPRAGTSKLPPIPLEPPKRRSVSHSESVPQAPPPRPQREPPTLKMNAGEVLTLQIQMYNAEAQPRTRGDDRLFVFALHLVEDCIVIMDVDDDFGGAYRVTARFMKAGPYQIHATVRQAHVLGSLLTCWWTRWSRGLPALSISPSRRTACVRMCAWRWRSGRWSA